VYYADDVMQISRMRVVGVGPIEDLTFRFADDEGRSRATTVIVGGAGVGKTSLLSAMASTRPGLAVVQHRSPDRISYVTAEWLTGDDDAARPHPLSVLTPNAPVAEDDDGAPQRRREQSAYDRRASEGGFVLVALSGARWFSKSSVLLSAPDRSLGRYDVRTPAHFDDATRADLARETKQALSYASIGAALSARRRAAKQASVERIEAFERALQDAVSPLAELAGYTYLGADPFTLEPAFIGPDERPLSFDELPTSVRHLVSFVALPLRALFAAYPARSGPPERALELRASEGVVLIDDVELHQDIAVQRALLPALRRALPRVQWIVTTSSPEIAQGCEASDVLALRRMPSSDRVELYEGDLAVVH
jgi:hypothetical protein